MLVKGWKILQKYFQNACNANAFMLHIMISIIFLHIPNTDPKYEQLVTLIWRVPNHDAMIKIGKKRKIIFGFANF